MIEFGKKNSLKNIWQFMHTISKTLIEESDGLSLLLYKVRDNSPVYYSSEYQLITIYGYILLDTTILWYQHYLIN